MRAHPVVLGPELGLIYDRSLRHVVAQVDAAAGLWDLSGMAVRVSKNVSLTPELEAFVDGQVASGRYQTASEVVRAGLRLLQAQEDGGRPRPRPKPAEDAPRDAR